MDDGLPLRIHQPFFLWLLNPDLGSLVNNAGCSKRFQKAGEKKVFRVRLGKILFDLVLAFLVLTPVLIHGVIDP